MTIVNCDTRQHLKFPVELLLRLISISQIGRTDYYQVCCPLITPVG